LETIPRRDEIFQIFNRISLKQHTLHRISLRGMDALFLGKKFYDY
jgi:hypothetical protein